MTEDVSLDRFVDRDGQSEGDGGTGDDTPTQSAAGTTPARTTYQWGPDRSDCERCGDPTPLRWRSEDGLVCPDCKAW